MGTYTRTPGGGVWLTVTVVHIRRYSRKPELHWPAMLWLLASAIADITITLSLSLNLVRLFFSHNLIFDAEELTPPPPL
ncbi:hypothetical protein H0H87_009461 [Tephrocybe sp. NHM501043]|nr:hypothetical protein H0H87_009461 [Tephrocybe sp. NHM501043]